MTSMMKPWLAAESICSGDAYLMVWFAEFNDRDGLYRCVTNYLATENVNSTSNLHDISLRPYLHDERMKRLLEARNLLEYLPERLSARACSNACPGVNPIVPHHFLRLPTIRK